jgi:hypothetical protein
MAGVPDVWRLRPMGAYLALGDGGAGFLCAGRLLDIPSVKAVKTELVLPSAVRSRLPGVVASRSTYLPDHHLMKLDALTVTTPARALCDMSARVSAETLGRIVRAAIRFDRTSYDQLGVCRDELRARGRRRTTAIDSVVAGHIAGTDPGDSEGEFKLLDWIAKAGFPIPKQQVWVSTAGGRYCLDLAYPGEKIDIEWDSELHERTPEDVEYDAARDIELELAGWLVMRASVLTKRATFLRRVESALTQRAT